MSAISPYEETRRRARATVEELRPFVEVFVKASVDECARRDVKGLHENAFKGIRGFTGVDDLCEEPAARELVVDTEELEPQEAAELIVRRLGELELVQDELRV